MYLFIFSVSWVSIEISTYAPVIVTTTNGIHNPRKCTALSRTQSIQLAGVDSTLSSLPMGVGLLYTAFLNRWFSIASNEHHWDEVKSLKELSGQHMQPSQDVRPQAAFPQSNSHPPLQPQFLWLRAFFLPEEVGCCCCWNCHSHLKGLAQSTGATSPKTGLRDAFQNKNK